MKANLKNFVQIVVAVVLMSSPCFAGALEGLSLPAFAQGEAFSSSTVAKQERTLVQFWAQWCGSCKKNIKDIYALQGKHNFKFAAVNVDEEKKDADNFFTAQLKKRTAPPFKQDSYYDVDKKLLNKLGVRGLPTILVLDRSGKILGTVKKRLNPKRIAELEKLLTVASTPKKETPNVAH
jgi:thiol-disulfide isomerase/thioredoxin